jgi:hypothetical protein
MRRCHAPVVGLVCVYVCVCVCVMSRDARTHARDASLGSVVLAECCFTICLCLCLSARVRCHEPECVAFCSCLPTILVRGVVTVMYTDSSPLTVFTRASTPHFAI